MSLTTARYPPSSLLSLFRIEIDNALFSLQEATNRSLPDVDSVAGTGYIGQDAIASDHSKEEGQAVEARGAIEAFAGVELQAADLEAPRGEIEETRSEGKRQEVEPRQRFAEAQRRYS